MGRGRHGLVRDQGGALFGFPPQQRDEPGIGLDARMTHSGPPPWRTGLWPPGKRLGRIGTRCCCSCSRDCSCSDSQIVRSSHYCSTTRRADKREPTPLQPGSASQATSEKSRCRDQRRLCRRWSRRFGLNPHRVTVPQSTGLAGVLGAAEPEVVGPARGIGPEPSRRSYVASHNRTTTRRAGPYLKCRNPNWSTPRHCRPCGRGHRDSCPPRSSPRWPGSRSRATPC